MNIAQPAAVLTDYAIAAEAAVFSVQLVQQQQWAVRLWAIAFASVAIAALLGGTFHGIGATLDYGTQLWLWKTTMVSLGIASVGLEGGTIIHLAPLRWRGWLMALIGLKSAFYFYWITLYNDFAYAVGEYLSALCLVLLLAIVHQCNNPNAKYFSAQWLIGGVAVSGVATLILGGGAIYAFDFSALYHLVQMVALYLFYQAVKQFQYSPDAQPPSLSPTQGSMRSSNRQPQEADYRAKWLKRWLNRGFVASTGLAALLVVGLLVGIAIGVARDAQPAIAAFGWHFLLDRSWNPVTDQYGVLPMLRGTVISAAIALLLATPIALGTAIFLSEDFLPKTLQATLVFLVELLAAIPSVVYGLWGFFILIPLLKPLGSWLHQTLGWLPLFSTPYLGPGLLPASLLLTLMILPLIAAIARESLLALPGDLRDASLSLGASRWTTLLRVLLPAASSGIGSGIMLALGRALGETMAVTMVIGNSNNLTASLLAPANTISSLLANQFNEARGLQVAALMNAALILFGVTLIVNVLAEWIVLNVKRRAVR